MIYDDLKKETEQLKSEIKEKNSTIQDIFGKSCNTIKDENWRYKKILKLGEILQETVDEKPKNLKVGEK